MISTTQMIHETVIKDIVDVFHDLKDSDEIQMMMNKKDGKSIRSIAKSSSNLILTFPVLCSNTLGIETAGMVTKAVERKCVTMLQLLFNALSVAEGPTDAFEYLKTFHTNMAKMNIDDYIDAMEKITSESSNIPADQLKTIFELFREDMKNLNYTLEDSIEETSLAQYMVSAANSSFPYHVSVNEKYTPKPGNGGKGRGGRGYQPNGLSSLADMVVDDDSTIGGGAVPQYDLPLQVGSEPLKGAATRGPKIASTTTTTTTTTKSISSADSAGLSAKTARDIAGAEKDHMEFFHKQLIDTDVKKANELQPTLMVVRVVVSDKGATPIAQQFVVGVKAKLIPMDSFDIIQRIQVKNDDHKGMLKFLRATTREISFFKDFVFAIDRAKLDAMAYSKNSTYASIWKMLERRSVKGSVRNGFQMRNDATRIASLVISQEEVEYLKKSGVDIDNGNVARVIIDAYGLLSFIIVNESLEVVRFLFDDDSNIFEDISFRNLERESGDKDYRKIVNLMAKMR